MEEQNQNESKEQQIEQPKQMQKKEIKNYDHVKTFESFFDVDMSYKIKVQISEIQQIESKTGNYTIFIIKGNDQEGDFEVRRRYSDFETFRQHLVQRWPGCYIPPIPSKKALGNLETDFLEERKRFLQYFLEKVVELKYIFYGDEGKIFFKCKSYQDVKQLLSALPQLNTEDLVYRIQQHFHELADKEITVQLIQSIYEFKIFLENTAKIQLENMRRSACTLHENKQQFSELYSILICKLIPNYEEVCVSEFQGADSKILAFSKNDQVKDEAQQISQLQKNNSFTIFYDFIKTEQKEVDVFLESIQVKEQYEQTRDKLKKKVQEFKEDIYKLESGKSTMKSFFSSGTKDENKQKLQHELKKLESELVSLNQLVDFITLIIGCVQVDKFKIEKQRKYLEMLINLSGCEITFSKHQVSMWEKVKNVVEDD